MEKINSIQYLRAISVLMVVVFHCSIRSKQSISEEYIYLLRVGSAGVDIFFVISGFIMWTIASHRDTSPTEFIIRRAVRIYPIYWIMTTIWVLMGIVGIISWLDLSFSHLAQSYILIPHYSESYPNHIYPVLVPGWTLIYEIFFYLIFSATLFLKYKLRLFALSAAMILLVFIGAIAQPSFAIASTYTNPIILEFLAGVLIAHMWLRKGLPRGFGAFALLAIGFAGIAASSVVDFHEENYRFMFWGVPAAAIVAGALGIERFQADFPLGLSIGNSSYSIYLIHIIVLTVYTEVWERLGLFQPSILFGAAFIATGVLASCIAGYVAFRMIERPVERYSRRKLLG